MEQAQSVATNATIAITATRPLPSFWTLPRSIRLDWSYPATDARDLRVDLLRGFAVLVMVVNHFGGASWFYLITGGNYFFSSGAEAFVFISGLVVGMVYGAIALRAGLKSAAIKAFKRALTLYRLTVVLTLLFATVSFFFCLPWAKGVDIRDPLTFALNVVTLRETFYLTDIPLMYTFLMLAAPLGLGLLYKGRTTWLLAGSTALWAAFQLFPGQVQVPWPVIGNTTFNVAAWQLLFFVAMAIGYHRDALAKKLCHLPRWPFFLLSGVLMVWLVQFYNTNGAFLARMIPGIDTGSFMTALFLKSAVAPGRLMASLIVFQFAYLAANLFWKPISAVLGWLLLPLGQNALYGYTMHVVGIGAFNIALNLLIGPTTDIAAINTTSLQLMFVLVIWIMIERRFLFGIVPR